MTPQYFTSADGTHLRTGSWGEGSRDLLVIPGLAEHIGRYEHVATALAAEGWRVVVIEVRGHGLSAGERGHVDRWDRYGDDVRVVAASLRPGFGLLGHSMGGLIALDVVRAGLTPSRLAVSNPLLGVRVKPPSYKLYAAGLLSRFLPRLAMGNELKSSWLSRDPKVGAAYDADPLVYKTLTPRWYTELLIAQARVLSSFYPLPTHFFLTPDDPITDTSLARSFAQRVGAGLTEYPGMLHEPFNEIGKEQVIADVARFLAG